MAVVGLNGLQMFEPGQKKTLQRIDRHSHVEQKNPHGLDTESTSMIFSCGHTATTTVERALKNKKSVMWEFNFHERRL